MLPVCQSHRQQTKSSILRHAHMHTHTHRHTIHFPPIMHSGYLSQSWSQQQDKLQLIQLNKISERVGKHVLAEHPSPAVRNIFFSFWVTFWTFFSLLCLPCFCIRLHSLYCASSAAVIYFGCTVSHSASVKNCAVWSILQHADPVVRRARPPSATLVYCYFYVIMAILLLQDAVQRKREELA